MKTHTLLFLLGIMCSTLQAQKFEFIKIPGHEKEFFAPKYEDVNGNLWFVPVTASKPVLVSFNNGNWKTYTNNIPKVGMGQHEKAFVFETNRGVWYTDRFAKGISFFDGKSWTLYNSKSGFIDFPSQLMRGATDDIVAINSSFDVAIWNGEKWNRLDAKKMKLNKMHKAYSGNIIISGENGAGFVFVENGIPKIIQGPNNIKYGKINTIQAYEDNDVWVSTTKGALHYNGTKWELFDESKGLVSNYVNSVYRDSDNNYWIGTNAGVSKFENEKFINYTIENGLKNSDVYGFYTDKADNIWFISLKEVSKFNGNSFVYYSKKNNYGGDINNLVTDEKGKITVLYHQVNMGARKDKCAINIYDNNSWQIIPLPKINSMASVANNYGFDKEGNIWVAFTFVGTHYFNGTKWVTFTQDDGLPSTKFNTVYVDEADRVWVGTDKGLVRYKK